MLRSGQVRLCFPVMFPFLVFCHMLSDYAKSDGNKRTPRILVCRLTATSKRQNNHVKLEGQLTPAPQESPTSPSTSSIVDFSKTLKHRRWHLQGLQVSSPTCSSSTDSLLKASWLTTTGAIVSLTDIYVPLVFCVSNHVFLFYVSSLSPCPSHVSHVSTGIRP